MSITSVNNRPVYGVTAKDVGAVHFSPFIQASEKWVEGSKKDSLSDDELNSLRKKYNNFENMTDQDNIRFFGDLVESGIITKEHAIGVHLGLVPIDASNYNGESTGSMCTEEADNKSFGQKLDDMSTINESNKEYFDDYQKYLSTIEQLKRNKLLHDF